ncbi:hypothetical protein A2U01_0043010, partial [Trifolium medium]|nr:hypothetical protein [Trifolium medium]
GFPATEVAVSEVAPPPKSDRYGGSWPPVSGEDEHRRCA